MATGADDISSSGALRRRRPNLVAASPVAAGIAFHRRRPLDCGARGAVHPCRGQFAGAAGRNACGGAWPARLSRLAVLRLCASGGRGLFRALRLSGRRRRAEGGARRQAVPDQLSRRPDDAHLRRAAAGAGSYCAAGRRRPLAVRRHGRVRAAGIRQPLGRGRILGERVQPAGYVLQIFRHEFRALDAGARVLVTSPSRC